ncbi:uncharacterized protein LOC141855715 [Brevipalpus obovatus]|uniref:uncharacterized protein LOC141855715 n=1 Tax=Brevipalpus obovatus TaxID=246614 RepID=UPI003D9E1F00
MMVNIRGLIKKPNKIVAKPNLSAASNRTRPVAKVKQDPSPKNNNNHHKNNHINGTNGFHNNNHDNINGKRRGDKSERYVQGSILFEAPRKDPTVNVKPTFKREPNLISSEVIPRNKHIKRESDEITTESLHNIEASSDEDELVDPDLLYKDIAERDDDNDENMTPLLWDLYDGSLKKGEDVKTSEFTEVKSKPVIKKEPGTEDDDDVDHDQKPDIDIDRGIFSIYNNEDLILLQMPQILLNRKDEKFGKLRVYKSGKLELLDTKNGIVYDVQRVYSQDDAPGHLKTFNNDESKCNLQKNNLFAKNNSMRRDAVVFADRDLVCLGSIENTDVLLVGPKVEQFMHFV